MDAPWKPRRGRRFPNPWRAVLPPLSPRKIWEPPFVSELPCSAALNMRFRRASLQDFQVKGCGKAPLRTWRITSAACGANVTRLNQDVQQLLVTLLFLGGITTKQVVATKQSAPPVSTPWAESLSPNAIAWQT